MTLLTTILGVVVAGLAYWQFWRWTHRRMLELARNVPGPPALPILGNALIFMVNPTELLNKINMLHEVYGQYFKFWLGPDLNICVKNPADIRKLLTSNKVNLKGPLYDILKPVIGPGILTGGLTWRNHRKIATPSYNKRSVEHFIPIFNTEAELLAKTLGVRDMKTPFNIYTDVVKSTTQSVNQTLMGLSKEESQNIYRMEELVQRTPEFYDLVFTKMTRWWLQIPLVYWLVGGQKKEDYLAKLINDFAGDVMKKRMNALESSTPKEESLGIVDRYLLSGELTEQEIRWETFTLFTTEQVYNEIIDVLGPDEPGTGEQ